MRALFVVLVCVLALASANAQNTSSTSAPDLTRHVDPFIGTDGTGHVSPGALVPFGMVFPAPDNAAQGWSYSSGYQFNDKRILGFSNTRQSGTGIPELGDILLQPSQGRRWTAKTTDFSAAKSQERAVPGYYGVTLQEHGVRVDLTATERVALQRYTFKRGGRVQLLVDLQHGLLFTTEPRVLSSSVSLGTNGLTGTQSSRNWVERQTSFAVQFSAPIQRSLQLPLRSGDKAPRYVLDFDLGSGRVLEARVALSTVDAAGASANLATDLTQPFATVQRAANMQWNALLTRIQIDADLPTKRLFYSALYRSLMHPANIADVDGRVRGPRGGVINAPGGVYYSTLSLWDTIRASHPLFTLVVPERVSGFVDTMVAHQEQMGYLPLWTAWGRETHTMIGNPAMPVIADAVAKGLVSDPQAALRAMLATSTEDRPDAPAWAQRSWKLLDQFGYLPFDQAPGESVSKTAEYGYGDAALAQVARQLGQTDLAQRFASRAANWQNLFDPSTQTLRGKDRQGQWRTPFDPAMATSPMNNPGDYTEANAWQYTATPALHDVQGFRDRLGGPKGLEAWLDRFFTLQLAKADKHLGQEALIGQYAHGNEPSHHIAWLYAYTNAPEKGHARVAEIVRRFYSTQPNGIVGNDDAGQMSAWLVFASLGLYPAEPMKARYVLGRPLMRKATLWLPNQQRLTIQTSAGTSQINGRDITTEHIGHAELAQGGNLQIGYRGKR